MMSFTRMMITIMMIAMNAKIRKVDQMMMTIAYMCAKPDSKDISIATKRSGKHLRS